MHVVVAVDGSKPAREAFTFALETFPKAEITALNVIDPYDLETRTRENLDDGAEPIIEKEREHADKLFADLADVAGDRSIETDTLVGRPDREIVDYVEAEPVDLLVIGSHGRSGISRVLLGSVAETVARRATVPVTIVR